MLRALVMENFNPSIRTVVQILSPRNKEALVQASVDTVVCIDELKMQVLAQNVLCPGFVTIFDNLSSTSGDPDPQGQYQPWFLEYSNGRSLELYSVPLAGPLVGLPFRAAARRVYLSTGGTCLLVGFQEPLAPEQAHAARNAFSSGDGESAFVHVFPDDGYTIGPRTKGIVMAPDARDAATLNDASLFRSLQDSVAQTGAWLTEPAQGGAADAGRVAEQTGADALGGSEAGTTASSEARCSSEEGMNEPASAPARRGKARLPARSLLSPPGSPAHRGVAFADGPGSPRVDPASGLVSRVLSTRSLQASLPPLPPNLQGHVLALGTVEHLDALVTSLFHPDLLGTRWEKDVVVLTAVCPPSLMELVHTHPNLYCLLGNPERIEDLEAAGISVRPHPQSPQFCCSRANPLPTSVPPPSPCCADGLPVCPPVGPVRTAHCRRGSTGYEDDLYFPRRGERGRHGEGREARFSRHRGGVLPQQPPCAQRKAPETGRGGGQRPCARQRGRSFMGRAEPFASQPLWLALRIWPAVCRQGPC